MRNLIDLVVMNIQDKGLTVKQLKNELESYENHLPVYIKENRLKPIRFPDGIIGIDNQNDVVYLKIPQRLADLAEQ